MRKQWTIQLTPDEASQALADCMPGFSEGIEQTRKEARERAGKVFQRGVEFVIPTKYRGTPPSSSHSTAIYAAASTEARASKEVAATIRDDAGVESSEDIAKQEGPFGWSIFTTDEGVHVSLGCRDWKVVGTRLRLLVGGVPITGSKRPDLVFRICDDQVVAETVISKDDLEDVMKTDVRSNWVLRVMPVD